MANKHGEFIWYELMTRDPDTAQSFYRDVVGWTTGEQAPGDLDYRMISAHDGYVGGMLRLTDEMCEHGARPAWLGYVGVDDVDATVAKLEQLGGAVHMPARDLPDIGRLAMVADPQGVPFYVMRGTSTESSRAFEPMTDGHCSWNELATTDQAGALSFYGQLFGWASNEAMPMGDMREYRILEHGDDRIGAVTPYIAKGGSAGWLHYFRVADLDASIAKTQARSGAILHGPHDVPGGDRVVIGADPDGATFALVAPPSS